MLPSWNCPTPGKIEALRSTVRKVAALNLSYFGIEFAVALAIGSVALFADSVDFLEDGAVNLLILAGLGFSAARRAKLGMLLAAIILVPALATLWTAWHNVTTGLVPEAVPCRSPASEHSSSISSARECWRPFARQAAASRARRFFPPATM